MGIVRTRLGSICDNRLVLYYETFVEVSLIISAALEACSVSGISLSLYKQGSMKSEKAPANKESSSSHTGGLQAVMEIKPSLHCGNVFIMLGLYCINNLKS